MEISHKNSGYALLMMLVMLLGVGSSWLGVSMHSRQAVALPDSLSEYDVRRLVDARQSLLSYAALYPYLYGPSGAGPAHLPCPDTDGYALHVAQPESALTQRRDGANPPCASHNGSMGKLPRHTILPGNRYLFHAEPWQRFSYRVAGRVVNNPVNRIVNLHELSRNDASFLARIELRSPDNESVLGQVVISGQALRGATAASVAAWIKSQIVAPGHSTFYTASADCPVDDLLFNLVDKPLQYSQRGCLVDELHLNTLEGVVATRHWFVRNLWHYWVNILHAPECEPDRPADARCELVYFRNSASNLRTSKNAGLSGTTLLLEWKIPS